MATMHIELELTDKQVAALRGSLQVLQRQRMQEEFWRDQYRYIPHAMRAGSIVAHCPDMAAGIKLLAALQLAERDSTAGGES
ncbi:hypothetical protein ACBQ16_03770 [Halopseudomonas bauzanensis]|uniref:hypothetical protein n=1 Tax=Halopseudomonas bauzanensis TaxID=653930 RepID=UPI003525B3AD